MSRAEAGLLPFLPLHEAGEAGRLRELADRGRGADLLRLYALEALLYGCDGGLSKESAGLEGWHGLIGGFMAENLEAFTAGRAADACALMTPECLEARAGRESMAREALRAMAQSKAAVRPCLFSDVESENIRSEMMACPLLVLPGCGSLTKSQQDFLMAYDRAGGRILAHGDLVMDSGLESRLQAGGRFLRTEDSPHPEVAMARFAAGFRQWIKPFRSFTLPHPWVNAHPAFSGQTLYIHLLNYDYDEAADLVRPASDFFMTIKGVKRAELLVPGLAPAQPEAQDEGQNLKVIIKNLPLYALLKCVRAEKAG